MTSPATRCHFDFVDEGTVMFSDGRSPPRKMKLRIDDTSFDTLTALSVYVMNTRQTDCWPGLIQLLGRHLFEFLLPETGIRGEVSGYCNSGRVHINLTFHPDASRYAQLPWEFLSVPVGREWKFLGKVGNDVAITLTRHVPMQRTIDTLNRNIQVLVDVASPRNMVKINSKSLEQKLNELEDRSDGAFKARVEHNRSLSAIRADLEATKPDIFHWSGHGDRNALWVAEADADEIEADVENLSLSEKPLQFKALPPGRDATPFKATIDAITDLFKEHAPSLVVLDACGSDWSWQSEMLPGVAHQLVGNVPAVIAMRYPIDNKAASTFAVHLYQGIHEGMPLDQAFQRARNMLAPGSTVDRAYGTPVLYLERSLPFWSGVRPLDDRRADVDQGRHETHQPFPCVGCEHTVNPGRVFCPRCGTRYQCVDCKAWFQLNEVKGMRYCPECGSAVPERPTHPGPRVEAATERSSPPEMVAAQSSQMSAGARPGPGPAQESSTWRGFRIARDDDSNPGTGS